MTTSLADATAAAMARPRTLAIFGPSRDGAACRTDGFVLEGIPIACAVVEGAPVAFDPQDPGNTRKVLVRKRAFSCNYRDRALILSLALNAPPGSWCAIGSDFVAEVVAVGGDVRALRPGQRVIGNAAYPHSGVDGVRPGVPTNTASREFDVFHESKLYPITAEIPDEVAAGFTIGAQTTYSMIRRLGLSDGERVLVTGGRSNTSLFALAALARRSVEVHVSTTSPRHAEALRRAGASEVVVLKRDRPDFKADAAVQRVLRQGGYNGVIDPFADVNLALMPEIMAMGGRYVTCGVYDQHTRLTGGTAVIAKPDSGLILQMMMKNLSIMGNCIGLEADLAAAVADAAAGRLPVMVDSVHTGDPGAFFDRTYNAPERFGKVVFRYV